MCECVQLWAHVWRSENNLLSLFTTWIKLRLGGSPRGPLSHLAGLPMSFLTFPHTTLHTPARVNTSSSLNSPSSSLPLGLCTQSSSTSFFPLSFRLTSSVSCHLTATSSGELSLTAEDHTGEPSWGLSSSTSSLHCWRSI